MLETLAVLLTIATVLSIPTYYYLRERARRIQAEDRLARAQRDEAPPIAPRTPPPVPFWIGDAPRPRTNGAQQLLDTLLDEPAPAPASRITRRLEEPPPAGWEVTLTPPGGIGPIRAALDQHAPDDPYAFGIMWVQPKGAQRGAGGGGGGDPALVYASLRDEQNKVNFLLGTGEPEHGKNVLIDHMLLPMLERVTPDQLRICVFDGTRADGAMTRGVAHNWIAPILEEEQVADGLKAWRMERKRREALLDQYGVTKWERLPDDVRPPLLLFVVNEVTVLAKGMAKGVKVEDWLDVELKAMRKCGMRAWLFAQNVSGMQTNWRDTCSMKLAGYQPVDRLCEPNTGLTAGEVRKAGALAPPELIERGMFTLVEKGGVLTGRTGYLDDDERMAAWKALRGGTPRTALDVIAALDPNAGLALTPAELAALQQAPAPAPVAKPELTEVPDGLVFAELPGDDQYSLIRVWNRAGLTGNAMLEKMRPIARQRGQRIIRGALGQARADVLIGPEEVGVDDAG